MSEQQKTAPQDIRNVANFLRSGKGDLRTRVGLWNGKRVDYFKGASSRPRPPATAHDACSQASPP